MAKLDIRKIVTEKIIKGLEAGKIPWIKPWNVEASRNFDSKKPYRGLNALLLNFIQAEEGWSPYWMTFNAMRNKGYHLKPDQHATQVAYFNFIDHKDEKGEVDGKIPLLRYYNVFNLSQMENVTIPVAKPLDFVPDERAEEVIENYKDKPAVSYGGDRAFYVPETDKITLPRKEYFKSVPEFYSTAFHEFAHSTGHPNRLNRKGVADFDRFGSEQYGLEELIAEFTSAFLCAEVGMEKVVENQTAYIQNWLSAVKDDRQMLMTAAGQAQKAADHILGKKFSEEE